HYMPTLGSLSAWSSPTIWRLPMPESARAADPVPSRAAREVAATPAEHNLGILFVHGIGDQPEGNTLLAFGEPLLQWLNRWLHRVDGEPHGDVSVVKTLLTPSKLDQQVPPHAELCVEFRQGEGASESSQSWLMAESWWGGDVKAPAFGQVAGWMMTVGAWSILSHLSKRVRRLKHVAARIVVEIALLPVWLVLAAR